MNDWELIRKAIEREYPFPIRVLRTALWVSFVILSILWLNEYPSEEWPFVSGVFVVSLWVASMIVWGLALVAVKLLGRYAAAVAARRGIEVTEPEKVSGTLGVRLASVLIPVVMLGMASWGLGLYALSVVIGYMEMPALGERLQFISLVLAAVGGLGFTAIIAVLAWFFRTVDQDHAKIALLSKQFRERLMLVVEMGRKVDVPVGFALGGRASG